MMVPSLLLVACVLVRLAAALGLDNVLKFRPSDDALTLATTSSALSILYDSSEPQGVHIAVQTFANDIERVTGIKPTVYADVLPLNESAAIVVGTVDSPLVDSIRQDPFQYPDGQQRIFQQGHQHLKGKWEAFDARVLRHPLPGLAEALVVVGSDRRGTIYALYSLSEQMGVSPWYWWADVPTAKHKTIAFQRSAVHAHGEPTVKYRGLFLNDEQPVLWNWARDHFGMGDRPPFQVEMYERMFELLLRLRGNYMWPAMWASMFAVDGLPDLPNPPAPGPNQELAERMGIVMGTSHHEPMGRNKLEFDTFGSGDWDFETNSQFLQEFWTYGAQRANACETVYTVGMRGNGDLPLEGSNVKLLENITATQQAILRKVHGKETSVPQVWAMYKEVMGYFAKGLHVPDSVTPLLSDDNWGNLMAVLPPNGTYKSGGGIYYHADYVGDPRSYKWINTVPLAKMWEQLNVALSFNTTQVWILNVGDLKMLEVPTEYFLTLAYDAPRWGRESLFEFLATYAKRDFGVKGDTAAEIADIMATYSMYASRRKAELVDSNTFSLLNYDEAERVLDDWRRLEVRAQTIHDSLSPARAVSFYQVVLVQIMLQSNVARMYVSAAKSILYASQGRTSANMFAHDAIAAFHRDAELTDAFHAILGGKWNHMLSQPHIGYQYWQSPVRNALPPVSFVSRQVSYDHGLAVHTRFTVENSAGAWPGDNQHNCGQGYECPDPVLLPMDRYSRARWVDVSSGGPEDVNFTVTPDEPWLVVSATSGRISGGGEDDVRVHISVDWDTVQPNDTEGHVTLRGSDGAHTVVTVPIRHVSPPHRDFCGSVEGDGYVAIEAARHTRLAKMDGFSWAEIPYLGRTASGMALFPVSTREFAAGSGPSMVYDFWATSTGKMEITLHLSPSLNFILGRRLAVALQIDDGEVHTVYPVPLPPAGTLPRDWEEVVANEIRKVTINEKIANEGHHRLTVYAVTTGVVVQRILIDFGGITERGYSYLGPPASLIVNCE